MMGNLKVQAIGLCRFSYLGSGGFKIAHDTLEDHRRYLYNPKRLDLRMIWFEQVFLPAWHQQTLKKVAKRGPERQIAGGVDQHADVSNAPRSRPATRCTGVATRPCR